MNVTNAFWAPYKELLTTVQYLIYHQRSDLVHSYKSLLEQHKNSFINLLKSPPLNATDRAELQKGPTTGAVLYPNTPPTKLPNSLVEEVLLLSDTLGLNEFSSLELLLVGEHQSSRYSGWTRGLVATILYHDGRRCILTALKTILQTMKGVSWSLDIPNEVRSYTYDYIDYLIQNDLVTIMLKCLKSIDLTTELTKLAKGGGVGDVKHKAMLSNLIIEQKQLLADCIFVIACQQSLNKKNTIALINFMRQDIQEEGDGRLDCIEIALLFSFIASIDVNHVLDDERVSTLCSFIPEVTLDLIQFQTNKKWTYNALCAPVMFAWAQLLRICSSIPAFSDIDEIDSDDALLDQATNLGLFKFIHTRIIDTDGFHSEELYMRKLHNLIASYIVNMPMKGVSYDPSLTNEGLVSRSQEQDHQDLLFLIGDMYGSDPFDLQLSQDYWQVPTSTSGNFKQIALFNFVRSCGQHLHSGYFIAYLSMLIGLSSNSKSAQHCFAMLRDFSSYAGCFVSLDHFFSSIKLYTESMKTDSNEAMGYMAMKPAELEGLKVVLRLLYCLSNWDSTIRISLIEHPIWQPIHTLFSLAACPVSPELKGELFRLISALAKTSDKASLIWYCMQNVEANNGIIVELEEVEARNQTYSELRGFLELLDQLTNQPLPATLDFSFYLNFLIQNVYLKYDTRGYRDSDEKWEVAYSTLKILLKCVKNYNPTTKVDMPATDPLKGAPPGFILLINLMHDSPLFHKILSTLNSGLKILRPEENLGAPKSFTVDKTCLCCLQLLEQGLEKGEQFRTLHTNISNYILLSPLENLLQGFNPTTSRADHMLDVAMFICLHSFSPELALTAINILCLACNNPLIAKQMCPALLQDATLSSELLAGFVQRIEVEDWENYAESEVVSKDDTNVAVSMVKSQIRINIIQLLLMNMNVPTPNLVHYLLGFDTRGPPKHTVLEDPGIASNPRTCLHAILYLLAKPPTPTNQLSCHYFAPQFAQMAYQCLYILCANQDLSASTMRYLRSSKDFIYKQLEAMPFYIIKIDDPTPIHQQQSWLLRMVALELHLTSRKQQKFYTQKLISLLLAEEHATEYYQSEKTLRLERLCELSYNQPHLLDSWKRVIDVLLMSCSEDYIPLENRFPLLIKLAQTLLNKALSADCKQDCLGSMTSAVLTLLSHFAYLINNTPEQSDLKFIIDTKKMTSLLKSLLDLLTCNINAHQQVRMHLYGTLLYYFQICRRSNEKLDVQDIYMTEEKQYFSFGSVTMSIFASYGDTLVDILCRDALDAHNIGKMLSFSLMEQILLFDEQLIWLRRMHSLGYLRHIIDSLAKQDSELCQAIQQGSKSAQVLLYGSKISFLTQIAASLRGPELLIQTNIFNTITNMSFIDMRPEGSILQPHKALTSNNSLNIYSKMLTTTLRLMLTLLSSMGSQHIEIIYQVTNFFSCHSELIINILKPQTNLHTIQALQELSIVTNLACHSCAHYLCASSQPESSYGFNYSEPLRVTCTEVQRAIFNLLPIYCLKSRSSNILQNMTAGENEELSTVQLQASLTIVQIAHNILDFATVALKSVNERGILTNQNLNIGMLTECLEDSMENYYSTSDTYKQLQLKLKNLTPDDINMLPSKLREAIALREEQLNIIFNTIEKLAYLTWHYTEYYLVFAVPTEKFSLSHESQPSPRTLDTRGQTEAFKNKTQVNLIKIRQDIATKLNEDLFKRVMDLENRVTDENSQMKLRFLEALINRIKKLMKQKVNYN